MLRQRRFCMCTKAEYDKLLFKTVLESHPIMLGQRRFRMYPQTEYGMLLFKTVLKSHPINHATSAALLHVHESRT